MRILEVAFTVKTITQAVLDKDSTFHAAVQEHFFHNASATFRGRGRFLASGTKEAARFPPAAFVGW